MNIEKEKMLSGKLYNANEPVLVNERLSAKEILFEFNNLSPKDLEKRNQLLIKLIGKTPASFYIEPPFRCDYGYNIEIGNHFYANYNLVILDCAKVVIGDHAFIGPNVGIYTASHPLHAELRNQEVEYALPITIGNNVWIGGNVVINPGVNIGNNAVIGSGSVVTRDIPDDVVAVGNPCRVIRQITGDDRNHQNF